MLPRSFSALGAGTLAALLVGLAGCSSGDIGQTVPVQGKVMIDHHPLHSGIVSYAPDASKGNKAPVSVTGVVKDGEYTLQTTSVTGGHAGAPPGWYKVTIAPAPPSTPAADAKTHTKLPPVERIAHRYLNPDTTPLHVEVKAGNPASAYDLEATTR